MPLCPDIDAYCQQAYMMSSIESSVNTSASVLPISGGSDSHLLRSAMDCSKHLIQAGRDTDSVDRDTDCVSHPAAPHGPESRQQRIHTCSTVLAMARGADPTMIKLGFAQKT